MSFTALFSLFLVLIAQLRLVSSSPIQANAQAVVLSREELEVWSPSIIYPKGGEVWQVGQTVYNMTWGKHPYPYRPWDEPIDIPYQARNNTGVIMLGYLDGNDTENEHLDWQKPVASGFPITDGFVRFHHLA
ncbi:hypothetical protein BT96DRAFT_988184 [Gymnopus androsaceus JB14]|uniref:Uncharacterized protein n=1 Tax=Gymnopus androsaceus JB14 TaxID=1447944 RepID=A0A6A4I576_9AGAR|nr:hypothetical protein BT96DRAFT_988184 [Gymnopus androsaceus JB14]